MSIRFDRLLSTLALLALFLAVIIGITISRSASVDGKTKLLLGIWVANGLIVAVRFRRSQLRSSSRLNGHGRRRLAWLWMRGIPGAALIAVIAFVALLALGHLVPNTLVVTWPDGLPWGAVWLLDLVGILLGAMVILLVATQRSGLRAAAAALAGWTIGGSLGLQTIDPIGNTFLPTVSGWFICLLLWWSIGAGVALRYPASPQSVVRFWLSIGIVVTLLVTIGFTILHGLSLQRPTNENHTLPVTQWPIKYWASLSMVEAFPRELVLSPVSVDYRMDELPFWMRNMDACDIDVRMRTQWQDYLVERIIHAPAQDALETDTVDCLQWLRTQKSPIRFSVPEEVRAQYFLFPFDRVSLKLHGWTFQNPQSDSKREPMLLGINLWSADFEGWELQSIRRAPGYGVEIQLVRTKLIRILTLLLLAAFLLATPLVLLTESVAGAAQVSIAIGLGLWTARGALLPDKGPSLMAVDVLALAISLMLLLALGTSVILHLGDRLKSTKSSRQETYLTCPGSEVYHQSDCFYLRSREESDLRSLTDGEIKLARGLRPCKICC